MGSLPNPTLPNPPFRGLDPRTSAPLLSTGMTLSGPEFMRRFEAMPDVKKGELREGIVHLMTSPVRYEEHAKPDSIMQFWLGTYRLAFPRFQQATNGTIYLGPDDIYQPDAMLFQFQSDGGNVTLRPDGYLEGSPDLIVEIAASSAWIDVGKKKATYQKFKVKEYIAWRTIERQFCWWTLESGNFIPIEADPDGIHRSRFVPGLWLDTQSLFDNEAKRMVDVLKLGSDAAANGQK